MVAKCYSHDQFVVKLRFPDVLRAVLSEGMRLSFTGIALGLIGAGVFTRVLQHLLCGVTPTDPMTFGAVTLLLLSRVQSNFLKIISSEIRLE